jgi:hypothetical protein
VEINPGEGTETLMLDVQLERGLTLRIKAVDLEGKPLPGASVSGNSRLHVGKETSDALFELASFRPDEYQSIVIKHPALKLGKVVRLRAGDDAKGPVVVTLAPMSTIKGRAVDADGSPVPGARVRVDVEPIEGVINTLTNVVTESDGRFEVLDAPTGCEYHLQTIKGRRKGFGEAKVKPGQTTNVGDIKLVVDLATFDVTTAKRIEAPAAQAHPADVPITGRIVDLEGRPVVGVPVKVELVRGPKSGDLTPLDRWSQEWRAAVDCVQPYRRRREGSRQHPPRDRHGQGRSIPIRRTRGRASRRAVDSGRDRRVHVHLRRDAEDRSFRRQRIPGYL